MITMLLEVLRQSDHVRHGIAKIGRQIPHSKASYPNGVEVSADGETLYFAAFGASELVRMGRIDGSERTSVPIPHPDNLTWSEDGRILVAAHTAPLTEVAGCLSIEPAWNRCRRSNSGRRGNTE